jgi:hypothetical protein
LWVLSPYIATALLLRSRRVINGKWLLLLPAFVIGTGGNYEYLRTTVINLSGFGGLAFTYVPVIQFTVLILTWGAARVSWARSTRTAPPGGQDAASDAQNQSGG